MGARKRKLPQHKQDRIARCVEYLKKAGDMPAARALAKKDGFSQNASVWLSAVAAMLEAEEKAG